MFYGLDPWYFVFLAPALLLAAWASWRVHHAYAEAREIPKSSGYSGARTAEAILARYGVAPVQIEVADGFLSDHYDPARRSYASAPRSTRGDRSPRSASRPMRPGMPSRTRPAIPSWGSATASSHWPPGAGTCRGS